MTPSERPICSIGQAACYAALVLVDTDLTHCVLHAMLALITIMSILMMRGGSSGQSPTGEQSPPDQPLTPTDQCPENTEG